MRRPLLTDDERAQLFGIPADQDALIQHYTLTPEEIEIATSRRGARNQLGAALSHISLSGDYLWEQAAQIGDEFRPLRMADDLLYQVA